MPFWVLIVLFIASIIISELMRPKPEFSNARPAGLGDFNFPTADEGRPIPVVWGQVKVTGPNLVWYGNLGNVPIEETVDTSGLFTHSSETFIVGYRYKVGMHMAICHGEVSGLKLQIQDRDVATLAVSANGSVTGVSKFNFFGENNSIAGAIRAYSGGVTNTVDPYLARLQSAPVPSYRRVCHIVAYGSIGSGPNSPFFGPQGDTGFYIGNDEFVEPWAFIVDRYPTSLGTATPIINGNSANPAEILYELMTNKTWGAGMPASFIDTQSFLDAGVVLASEGFGLSLIWDNKTSVEEMMRNVLRHIDGAVFNDISTGKFRLKLARDDFDVGTIPVIDQSDVVEMTQFTRGALDETVNEIKIVYTNPTDNFKRDTAQAQDLANFQTQGAIISSTFQYPGIVSANIAATVAARELRTLSFPLAKIQIKVNRIAYNLVPGDVFKFTWAPLGIIDIVMRVTGVDYGTLKGGIITIDAVQDIFKLGATTYAAPQPTGLQEPSSAPADIALQDIWQMPLHILRPLVPTFNFTSEEANVIQCGIAAGADDVLGADVLTRIGSNPYVTTGKTLRLTPTGTLVGDWKLTTANADKDTLGITVFADNFSLWTKLVDRTAYEILNFTKNILFIGDVDLQAGEVIAFETVIDNGDGTFLLDNVHRGLMDTTPKDHLDGVRIWAVSYGGATAEEEYTDTATVNVKFLPFTNVGKLDVGSATQRSNTFTKRTKRPYAPGNTKLEGVFQPDAVTGDPCASLGLTWSHRDRTDPAQDILVNQSNGNIGPETGIDYRVRTLDQDGNQIRTETLTPGSSFTSYTYAATELVDDSTLPGDRALQWRSTGSGVVTIPDNTNINSDAAGYTEKSVEVRASMGSDVTTRQVLWCEGDQVDGLNIYIDGGKVYAGIWSDTASPTYSTFLNYPVVAGETYMFSAVYALATNEWTLYVNGTQVAQTIANRQSLPQHVGGSASTAIGRQRVNTRYHDGNDTTPGKSLINDMAVMEVRHWSDRRTSAEIAANDDSELVGNETGLVALWKFNDNTGTNINDSTSNNIDGTISGTQTLCFMMPNDPLNAFLEFRIATISSGGDASHQEQARKAYKSGWGYNYGNAYGGL